MEIHGVKVYGDITPLATDVLYKLEKTLDKKYWKGLKAIHINQNDYVKAQDRDNDKLLGTYFRLEDISLEDKAVGEIILNYETPYEKTIKINKGEIPLICINTGFSSDPYYFAFVLLHELGHHNNFEKEKKLSHKQNEINAHLFAMEHVSRANIFQQDFEVLLTSKYYMEAYEIHHELEMKKLGDELVSIREDSKTNT
ncbi:hypothetical protein U6X16_04220 [Bacillus velezensis]|uniref:hypothetical protein n=1 Tax=Bacillus velezensis TaxID=492670 RepID=UPI002ADDA2B6|nr:hypothetical protein [Bacillus velezensis]MEA1004906.1 hypothetical protein [Bacillus velezensis]